MTPPVLLEHFQMDAIRLEPDILNYSKTIRQKMLRLKIESIIFNVDFFDTTYRRNTSVFLVIMPIASRRLHPEYSIQTVAAIIPSLPPTTVAPV